MYKLVLCLIVILLVLPSNAAINRNFNTYNSKLKMNQPKNIISTYQSPRRNNIIRSPYHSPRNYYNNYLSNNELSALEKHALNRTFKRENDLMRLERLENLAFGAVQNGDILSRYRNLEQAILSRPHYKAKNSVLGNIANYFIGQSTGFTPSFMPSYGYNTLGGFNSVPNFNFYNPGYSNNNFEQYSNGIFGGGWGYSGHDYGSGSSVKILD